MRHRIFSAIIVATLGCASFALADDYRLGPLTVSEPWARASAGKAKAGAAYLSIANDGLEVDRLLKAATPVAKKAAIHTHIMDGGIMKLRPVEALEVNPGEPAVLKPGGLHVMLMGLKAPLKEGETFPLTLTFEKAGTLEVQVNVQKPGAMQPHRRGHKKGAS